MVFFLGTFSIEYNFLSHLNSAYFSSGIQKSLSNPSNISVNVFDIVEATEYSRPKQKKQEKPSNYHQLTA